MYKEDYKSPHREDINRKGAKNPVKSSPNAARPYSNLQDIKTKKDYVKHLMQGEAARIKGFDKWLLLLPEAFLARLSKKPLETAYDYVVAFYVGKYRLRERLDMFEEGKVPYAVHPIRVGAAVYMLLKQHSEAREKSSSMDEIVSAALLHDVLEDAEDRWFVEAELSTTFGERILMRVKRLSFDEDEIRKKHHLKVQASREDLYIRYIYSLLEDYTSTVIKLADMADNLLSSPSDKSENKYKEALSTIYSTLFTPCYRESWLNMSAKKWQALFRQVKDPNSLIKERAYLVAQGLYGEARVNALIGLVRKWKAVIDLLSECKHVRTKAAYLKTLNRLEKTLEQKGF